VNILKCLTPTKVTGIALVVGLALLPRSAAAQERASVQATATVVDTKAGFAGLQQAKSAAEGWAAGRQTDVNDVSTVAQVGVAYRPATAAQTAALVVTIDYLKN